MTAPSFANDIKSLFREQDRLDMEFAFDLWLYEDVKSNADNILDRLGDHTMPCDAPWEDDAIQLFNDWMVGGFRP